MTEYAPIVALVVVVLLLLDGLLGFTGKVKKASDWIPRFLLGILIIIFSLIFPPLSGWIAHLTGMILLHSAIIVGFILFLIACGATFLLLIAQKRWTRTVHKDAQSQQDFTAVPKQGEKPATRLIEREKRVDTLPITDTMGIGLDRQLPHLETAFDYFESALVQQKNGNNLQAIADYQTCLRLDPSREEAQWAALHICAALKAEGQSQLALEYLEGDLRSVISDEWYRAIVDNLQSPTGI